MTESEMKQHGQDETTKMIVQIRNALKKVKRMPYFRFVVHPKSFSKTVENMFYVGFLIKEDLVALEIQPQDQELIIGMLQYNHCCSSQEYWKLQLSSL